MTTRPRVDNAMVKALTRAFRWRKMLDTGVHPTLEGLARAKGVTPSYVSRVPRLTLLAPEIVEVILDGRQQAELQLDTLLAGFPRSGRLRAWPLDCVRRSIACLFEDFQMGASDGRNRLVKRLRPRLAKLPSIE